MLLKELVTAVIDSVTELPAFAITSWGWLKILIKVKVGAPISSPGVSGVNRR